MSLSSCQSLVMSHSSRCWHRYSAVNFAFRKNLCGPKRYPRRNLSEVTLKEEANVIIKEQNQQVPSLESQSIVRHGSGDGVVTLNVGGKEFITLRSTLQINPVLRDRVLRAEANQEFGPKASIFIDFAALEK